MEQSQRDAKRAGRRGRDMTIQILLSIVAVAEFIALIYKEYSTAKERKDLLNRLMAKNYTEYNYHTADKPSEPIAASDEENYLMTDDAREKAMRKQMGDEQFAQLMSEIDYGK
jgi:hypothetical protein